MCLVRSMTVSQFLKKKPNFSRKESTIFCCKLKFQYTIQDKTKLNEICDKYVRTMMQISDQEIVNKLITIVVAFTTRTRR